MEQARVGNKMRPACDPTSNRRFWRFFLNVNGWTDGRTYGHMDIRTDTLSYRDARTHLKRIEKLASCQKICDAVDHHQRPTMC